MKIKFSTLLFILTFSGFANAQNKITVKNSDISSVKVYTQGAQIVREVKASLEAGSNEVVVSGISAMVVKSSITVSSTSSDVVVMGVQYELNYLQDQKKSPEIKLLEDSLESLTRQQKKIQNLQYIYSEEESLLKANKSVGGTQSGVDKDALVEVADYFRERMIDLKAKQLDAQDAIEDLYKKITRVSAQLGAEQQKVNTPTGSIILSLTTKQKTNARLFLSYYSNGASWTPQYDIRAQDIDKPVELSYKANVVQTTGEDWKNVLLTLSSGNPSIAGSKPVLGPWVLNYYVQQQFKDGEGRLNSMPATMELQSVEIRAARSKSSDRYYVDGQKLKGLDDYVSVDQSQFSVDFEITLPYTVKSDGKQVSVDVKSYQMNAAFSYYVAPKLDKDVFLLARITGWEELSLQAGNANIYFENSYVGNSYIDPRSTNDTLDIGLGRDKKIVVTREKKKDLSSKKFLGGSVEKELIYEFNIRNNKKTAIDLLMEDQFPISSNSDIKVTTGEKDGGELNLETGLIKWRLNIEPSGTVKKRMSFSVKYPKDRVISGL